MPSDNITISTVEMLDGDGSPDKPHLRKTLFWDVRHEEMSWRKAYQYVIGRVLERGSVEEIDEIVRFYGRRKVLYTLKKRPIYLMDCNIERACAYFNLRPEELYCYWRKRLRAPVGFWP